MLNMKDISKDRKLCLGKKIVISDPLLTINIRSIMIIKQIQNMNLMLNMKDINTILAKIESYVWGEKM
jgi:hypothetical protein